MTKTPDSPRRHTVAGLFNKPLPGARRYKGEQTSRTTSEPWVGAQEPLRRGYAAAEQFILDRPTEFFPDSTVIPFAPETTAALGATTNRALAGSPLLGGAQEYTGNVLAGEFTDPRTNPFLGDVSDAVLADVQPRVASTFSRAGRTGGSPLYLEALGRGVSRGMAPYLFGEYGRERGIQESAAGRAPGLAREDYGDIDRLGRVGATREAQAGEGLADQMARWAFAQEEPGRRAQAYASTISGFPIGTNETTRTSGGGSKGMDLLGLGLQGAGTAGALGWSPFAPAAAAALPLAGCWVAREIFGDDDPRWLLFRRWLFDRAPKWLRAAYLKYGERTARWLRGKERTKAIVRKWMDARVAGMGRS